VDLRQVVAHFEGGASLKLSDDASAADTIAQLDTIPGLLDHVQHLGLSRQTGPAPLLAAAGEFVLEGLHAQKKIGRSDERGYVAPERRSEVEMDLEKLERLRRMKKQVN
jgi:magnesium chelatase subunit I